MHSLYGCALRNFKRGLLTSQAYQPLTSQAVSNSFLNFQILPPRLSSEILCECHLMITKQKIPFCETFLWAKFFVGRKFHPTNTLARTQKKELPRFRDAFCNYFLTKGL